MAAGPKTRFVSFYSYKGGVGRTLALANCARALAQMGKTVAILDLDLEAPGLDRFGVFRPEKAKSADADGPPPPLAGFAEYLQDCCQDGPPRSLAGYFHPCQGMEGDRGRVFLMPAGKRDGAAYREILSFDWDGFYRDKDGYRIMENLRGHIAHNLGEDERHPIRPDYVLIDARTGLSETGGIATHQLADLVVLLFGLNRQNLEGTVWVHDSLANLPEPPQMLLVVSPLPEIADSRKGTLFDERMAYIAKHLARALNWRRPTVLRYRAVLWWDECILVDSDAPEHQDFDRPYRDLLTAILEACKDPEVFLDRAMRAWRKNDAEQARRALDAGLAANPDAPALLEARARLGSDRGPRVDLSHLPAGAAHFLGREAELAALDAAWSEGESGGDRIAIVELVAPGGTGKTALVKRWLDGLRGRGWAGVRRVFGWSFYSQDSAEDRQASEDRFLAAAIDWFAIDIDPAVNPADKGRALAEALIDSPAERRTLLVLDGCEPLQYPPGPLAGALRAPGLKALLTHLAGGGHPGLCVLTSRERVVDLDEWVRRPDRPEGSVLRLDLDNLSDADGARLLHTLGAKRAGAVPIGPDDAELLQASRAVRGHALTLSLLGRYLGLAHGGDIRRRDRVDLVDADRAASGRAFRVMAAYERWLADGGESGTRALAALRLLGFFDRPASPADLAALRAAPPIAGLTDPLFERSPGQLAARLRPLRPIPDTQWQTALRRLADAGLAAPLGPDGSLNAHPLLREYLAATLADTRPTAWREGHRRLYERLTSSAPHRPEGLDGLRPLYQAVTHGCLAGLWQEVFEQVYIDRILRGTGEDGHYSTRQLGAIGADLGALACFFADPWSRPVPALREPAQAFVLHSAAFDLRALGRLAEALEPMRAGAETAVQQEDWKNAAIRYGNLSELNLTLGRVSEATDDGRRSVEYAERSGDPFWRMTMRTALADALHQRGEREEAAAIFVEAESAQAGRQPQYPLLYSIQGFRYCDLLLAPVELAVWDSGSGERARESVSSCEMVAWRARRTLEWAEGDRPTLLDIARDSLTLARCALYSDLLQGCPPGAEAQTQSERALDGLRAAGQQDELPRGLLTRAWLRHAQGNPAGAAADLAEAERIASRGGMQLHLADCALYRARLFHDRAALAEARRLVETCGYGRRLPELRDAEAAAAHWPA